MTRRPACFTFAMTLVIVLLCPLVVLAAVKVNLPGFCCENDMKIANSISFIASAGEVYNLTDSLSAVRNERRIMVSGGDASLSSFPYGGAPAGAIPDKGVAGLVVEKPNIYIYSDEDSWVSVLLGNESRILRSDPVYKNGEGWHAKIINGSINGCDDYLFYEAQIPVSSCPVQKVYGFVIRSASIEQDMGNMLDAYNFSQIEKQDFVEYWISRLDDRVDWAFCPIGRNAVDVAMPLKITPVPDSIYRIWFYIIPAGKVALETPNDVVPICRSGYYAVEWGGVCD